MISIRDCRALALAAFIFVFLLITISPAKADTLSGSSGAAWQAFPVILNQDGVPFWDRTSFDGDKKNIGYCLTGTGNCGMSGAPGPLQYWGFSDGSADAYVYFNPTSGADAAALRIEIAGYANSNVFGWVGINSGAHVLFSGPQSAGATATINAQANDFYAFYLTSGNGQTYYTYSSYNPSSDQGFQHFAIFKEGGSDTYWIGVEDLSKNSGDKDYNDMVIKISPTYAPVPEPASLSLLGSALGGLAVFRRRFRR